MTLTVRQAEVLEFIKRFTDQHGFSPTYREIADHFSMSSPGTVANLVRLLKSKGYLENSKSSNASKSSWRSLTAKSKKEPRQDDSSRIIDIPLIASISQTEPLVLLKKMELVSFVKKNDQADNLWALHIKDSSFETYHIQANDLVIFEKLSELKMDSELASILLIGQDDNSHPCFFYSTDLESLEQKSLLGTVVALIRNY